MEAVGNVLVLLFWATGMFVYIEGFVALYELCFHGRKPGKIRRLAVLVLVIETADIGGRVILGEDILRGFLAGTVGIGALAIGGALCCLLGTSKNIRGALRKLRPNRDA